MDKLPPARRASMRDRAARAPRGERVDSRPPQHACYAPRMVGTLAPLPESLVPGLDHRILTDLKRENLLQEGHWAFRYGGHSRGLIDRDHLLSDPVAASHMAYAIAKTYFTDHI